MKLPAFVAISLAVVLLAVTVLPASAQLGTTDTSQIVIQNIAGGTVDVTVEFINPSGVTYKPNPMGSISNPFSLAAGASKIIDVGSISVGQLPAGSYSVLISSTGKVVAVANLSGSGPAQFSGSYTSAQGGSTTYYMPSFYYNYNSKWFSLLTVQNLGTSNANITVNIACEGGLTGQLTRSNIPPNASYTFVTKTTPPAGWTPGVTQCRGSAVITSNQSIVAADSVNQPTNGNTLTSTGYTVGDSKMFIPGLYSNTSGWNSGVVIRKMESGSTTVTVDFSDTASSTDTTCNLTDAVPYCHLYIPSYHAPTGIPFGATITASPAKQLAVVVNTTKGTLSLAVTAFPSNVSTGSVALPNLFKSYFNWRTGFVCQNVGTVNTNISIAYEGFPGNTYSPAGGNQAPGYSWRIIVFNEPFLPNGFAGDATITATVGGGKIACIVNATNDYYQDPTKPGDWSASYNGLSQ